MFKGVKQRIQIKLIECNNTLCSSSNKCEYCRKLLFNSIELCKTHKFCNICKQIRMIQGEKLTDECVVDHFHYRNNRGPIRGLLCKSCNIKEGKIRKSVDNLHSLAELEQVNGKKFIDKVSNHYKGIGGFLPMDIDTFPI